MSVDTNIGDEKLATHLCLSWPNLHMRFQRPFCNLDDNDKETLETFCANESHTNNCHLKWRYWLWDKNWKGVIHTAAFRAVPAIVLLKK